MPAPTLFWRLSKWCFATLVFLLLFLLATALLLPSFPSGQEGCYWTNRLLVFIDCPTLPGRAVIEFILNFPTLVLVYLPFVFPGFGLKNAPWLYVLVLMDWALMVTGLLYPVRQIYVKLMARKHGG